MNVFRIASILALLAVLALAGCGKKAPPPAATQAVPPRAAAPASFALETLPPVESLSAEAVNWPSDSTVEARLDRLAGLENETDAERVRAVLQLALADPETSIRMSALRRLELLPVSKAAPLLDHLIRIEPVADVRYAALDVVSHWSGPEAVPILAAALASPHRDAKLIASSQLSLRADKPSLEVLLTGLNEPDLDFRERVNDKIESLVDRRFPTYEEASAWWTKNAPDYDAKLFRKE